MRNVLPPTITPPPVPVFGDTSLYLPRPLIIHDPFDGGGPDSNTGQDCDGGVPTSMYVPGTSVDGGGV